MEFWHGRRVLLTGHTGFKGAWMSLWLRRLGARVTGLGLPPATEPRLWNLLGAGAQGAESWSSVIGDIRDAALVGDVVARADHRAPAFRALCAGAEQVPETGFGRGRQT